MVKGRVGHRGLEPSEEESLDELTPDWKIFQLKRGHRFSTDDLMTAWMAWRHRPQGQRLLDLGCGLGTVGLLTLHKMQPEACLTGVEVQEVSFELAQRTVQYNKLQDRVRLFHSDLRDEGWFTPGDTWDVITGSPPYFPLGTAVVSPHPQRAGARMELRGHVGDYVKRAAQLLSSDGVFSLCHVFGDPRAAGAIRDAGLVCLAKVDVVFREGKRPTITLYACAWDGVPEADSRFTIRDSAGEFTPEYLAMRAQMGMPDALSGLSQGGRRR
ncbi:MAG: methyltransferase [Myxococcota bacterium]|nr:methyltransferase [Myxococcota bacterium]